ncbi:MAG: response regulator [Spirochaetaceae bacterium]|nr:MAG: response regulator [Spirochaetaceae bacterium]
MSEVADPPSLHHQFLDEARQRTQRNTRVAAVAAAIAFPVFGLLDFVMYPDYLAALLTLRLAVVLASIVIYFTAYSTIGQHYPFLLAMVQYLVCSLGLVIMVHLTEGYLSPYYAGINLVLIVFVAILPLHTLPTLFICLVVYAAYIIPVLFTPQIQNWAILANNNFFLLGTILLVALSAHFSSRLRFKEFAARYRLAQANEELKTMDVLKSQFFANVSHEVRTPLTSIISPVQGLYQGDAGTLTREQHQLIAQVYRNGLRLLDMINQMLDFAKYDARRMQLRLTWVNMLDVCEDMTTVFGDVCRRKGVQLRLNAAPGAVEAYLDREKIERILSNLLRNAVKFTDSGSIVVGLRAERDSIVLTVTDSGIGIPTDRLDAVFERFRQVDGSSTRRYEGTGLGLAIVKEAVELLHGTIDVESEAGTGTTFTVGIPANLDVLAPDAFIERREGDDRRRGEADYSGPERRRSARRTDDFAHLSVRELALMESQSIETQLSDEIQAPQHVGEDATHVLYVEDNVDLRAFVYRMLGNHGYRVTVAHDGLEGWKAITSAEPDIVVTDVMMPHMDGFELLRRIRQDEQLHQLPVIMITAKSEMESRIEGLESGADDYLAKPINIRELDARIKNLIHMRKLQQSEAHARYLEQRIRELSFSFARTLELRDRYTAGHSYDVLHYGSLIAEELGVSVDMTLRESLLLHDVGKLGIPDSILLKEGPLSSEEWEVMKSHAELGAALLRTFDSFHTVSDIILAHQERYDGSGYPRGLKGEEIPLQARIIAVADSWHAMTEDRPYRKALRSEQAIAELYRNKGRQFDPRVVDAFLRGLRRQQRISVDEIPRAEFHAI